MHRKKTTTWTCLAMSLQRPRKEAPEVNHQEDLHKGANPHHRKAEEEGEEEGPSRGASHQHHQQEEEEEGHSKGANHPHHLLEEEEDHSKEDHLTHHQEMEVQEMFRRTQPAARQQPRIPTAAPRLKAMCPRHTAAQMKTHPQEQQEEHQQQEDEEDEEAVVAGEAKEADHTEKCHLSPHHRPGRESNRIATNRTKRRNQHLQKDSPTWRTRNPQ